MKKLKLELDGMKSMLTKAQMKRIYGGYSADDPSTPTGISDGISGGNGSGYKCCWVHNPSGCSRCLANAKENWTCQENAKLTAC